MPTYTNVTNFPPPPNSASGQYINLQQPGLPDQRYVWVSGGSPGFWQSITDNGAPIPLSSALSQFISPLIQLVASLTFTNAQILAGTIRELVTAAPVGYAWVVDAVSAITDTTAGEYGGGGGTTPVTIAYDAAGAHVAAGAVQSSPDIVLELTSVTDKYINSGASSGGVQTVALGGGAPLYAFINSTAGALSGGNAANTIVLSVVYHSVKV